MANMFMKLGDFKVKGAATNAFEGKNGDGWFAVTSMNWGCGRKGLIMDTGNMANTRESGDLGFDHIVVSKEMDGASENILSRLWVPGSGDTVEVIVTKRYKEESSIYFHIKLLNARICTYNFSVSDGITPLETFSLAYTSITLKHWNDMPNGEFIAGGDVTYDLLDNKPVSYVKAGTA